MKMKKFLSLLMLIGIICFSTTTIVFGEEIVYDAYYIVTTPGEDASTQMNINYHTHNKLTSLGILLLAISITKIRQLLLVFSEFEAKDDPTDVGKRVEDFELHNIVSVYLTGLELLDIVIVLIRVMVPLRLYLPLAMVARKLPSYS